MLVLQYKVVTPAYFLDELQPYEANLILKHLHETERPAWEQTRLQIYTLASIFSRGKLELTDIMQLPWDADDTTTETPTQETFEILKEKARQLENLMNNKQCPARPTAQD